MTDLAASAAQKTTKQPLEWEVHEYVHTEKSQDWYWALGLIAVAGAVAAIMFNNVLFAIFILIAAFVLALFAARKPDTVHFALTQRGIRVNKVLYPYKNLKSFAVDELSPNHTPKLIVESNKILAPHLIIPLEDVNADDVHDFLVDFLPEDDHVEPLTHRVMEWLGF